MGKPKLKFDTSYESPEDQRKLSRKKFHVKDMLPFEPMTDNQKKTVQYYWEKVPLLALHGHAGTGKAQPLDSLVKTPNGWTRIGDLTVGDEVVCPDGSISNVNAVYPQGVKKTMRVTFEDGRSAECCDEHLWQIVNINRGISRTFTTKELYEMKQRVHPRYFKDHRVPLVYHQKMDNIDLPIEPYAMGIILGDGSFTTGTISVTTADYEVVELLRERLSGNSILIEKHPSSDYTYGIKSKDRRSIAGKNVIKNALVDLGLHGKKSQDKFIPDIYLKSSEEQKIDLIAGLIDSDGEVTKDGSILYNTTSERLKDGFVDIIRSLGGIAYTKIKKPYYIDKNGERVRGLDCYVVRVRFRDQHKLTKLSRKKSKLGEGQYKDCNLAISDIEYIESKECVCISIDHPEHLYITNDYIVTHNTYCALALAFQQALSENLKVVIVRSAVQGREIGFTTGDINQKEEPYEQVYRGIIADIFEFKDPYYNLKQLGYLEFHSTTFLRGRTFDNCIIVVDEFQNMDYDELYSVVTRCGYNSRIVLCGDLRQEDLSRNRGKQQSGVERFMRVLKSMDTDYADHVEFGVDDIVRSGLVKEFIIADNNTSI